MKFALIVIAIIFLFSSWFFYRRRKMVFSPASLFTIIWTVMVIAFLILDDEKYPYIGIVWLLFGVLIVNIGQYLGTKMIKGKRRVAGRRIIAKEVHVKTTVLIFLCGFLIIYSLLNYFRSGGISNVASVAEDYYTNAESGGSFINSLWTLFFTFSLYISGFIGGGLFKLTKKRKKKIIAFLPFVSPLIMMFTTSGKLGVIVVAITFCIGYIIETIKYYRDFRKKQFIILFKKYWIIIPLVFFLFVASLVLRMGIITPFYIQAALRKIWSYAFGSPAAFNAWFTTNDGFDLGFGKNTFLGVFRLFGAERVQGVYQTLVTTDIWSTNVYTAFRGLIEDFGYFGALVFLLFVGVVFGVSYKLFYLRRKSISFWFLTNSYLFALYSFIISPFIYLNLSVLFLLYLIARYFIRRLFIYFGGSKRERHYFSGRQWDPSLSTDNGNK